MLVLALFWVLYLTYGELKIPYCLDVWVSSCVFLACFYAAAWAFVFIWLPNPSPTCFITRSDTFVLSWWVDYGENSS